jgi:ATP-dependent DNA helicase RecG
LKRDFLNTPIEYLKGVGPQKAEVLQGELNVFTAFDIIRLFPFRYIDKSIVSVISQLTEESGAIQIRGKLSHIQVLKSGNSKRLSAMLTDKTGSIDLVWFKNFNYLSKALKEDGYYTVYGKLNLFNGILNLPHPEIKPYDASDIEPGIKMEPVYPLTEKLRTRFMDSKFIFSLVKQVLSNPEFDVEEYIPEAVTKPLKLLSRKSALYHIHIPGSEAMANKAIQRIKFDEMFTLAMRAEKTKSNRWKEQKGIRMPKSGDMLNGFYHNHLSFELTDAQKRVIKEIRADILSGKQMNRLLQGDVGSGKTIVALFCMLMCIDNGYQSCMMAPTEILAIQHYITLKDQLNELDVKVELLTGSTTKKNRQVILARLLEGDIDILVGTHALIEHDVEFKNIGLTVIDEQHRFGVAQRAGLWHKYKQKPHVLVMTATPIPRTLAMTIHGELDVSEIDELPKNRKPIKTVHRVEKQRAEVMQFVKREILKGRQVYIVYPLIEESGKLDLKDLMNGYDVVCSYFPVPEHQISLLHGKMKPDVKSLEMQRFKDGITQIMISTTVIEVGVNVPNASVMIIEDANRFGLSQLHQLRGRVGRGAEQSYCVLMSKEELNYASKRRIQTMCKTNNGFQISQVDLELRGPGDVLGTRQSGLPDFKLLDLVKDTETIDLAKRAAAYILKQDPSLEKPENSILLNYLKQHQDDNFWSSVS